jgi:hypothetical protein
VVYHVGVYKYAGRVFLYYGTLEHHNIYTTHRYTRISDTLKLRMHTNTLKYLHITNIIDILENLHWRIHITDTLEHLYEIHWTILNIAIRIQILYMR